MLNKYNYFYNDEDSIVHMLNPFVKLISFLLFVIISFMKFNNYLFVCNIGLVFLLILLSNVHLVKYFNVLWKIKFFIMILYFIMYRCNVDFLQINIIIFKIVFAYLYMFIIIFTTTKEDISKGLAYFFNIINFIDLSFNKIMLFFLNIFNFVRRYCCNFIKYIEYKEINGVDFNYLSFLNKFKFICDNYKVVFTTTCEDMKKRSVEITYRMYNKDMKSKYKYIKKYNVFDYVLISCYVCMIVFYVLKVR